METQAFVENKVHFKLGAIFAADRAVSLAGMLEQTLGQP